MTADVQKWLESLGLAHYAELFAENDIDADVLPHLTDQDLRDLGLSLGHRRKLLAAIREIGTEAQMADSILAEPRRPFPTATDTTSAVGLDGERRQVTVLFADLSGFTKLTSEMDAEETHALLNRYFDATDAVVKRYGGMIDKHIGDAVMAVFGAPVAHADDPERAVRAALDIHRSVGALDPPLSAHIGIASGQVIASGTGSAAHSEYTVTGESVNLASRLTALAGSGTTLVSEAVRSALEDWLNVTALGETPIEGLPQPVKVWRVNGLSPRLGTADRRFVGRAPEMRQFEGAITSCLETGAGQAIYLRGEAGIGKTRLLAEFQSLAEENGFAAHTGLVLDFGEGKGQDAIRAIVRSLLSIPPGSDIESRARITESAFDEGCLDPERRVYLNDLLDLPQPVELHALYQAMDNATRNQGKRETVAELTRHASIQKPLFLAVEDIHWAGKLTLAHLASIARTVGENPIVLVMTSRIDGDPIGQAWRGAAGNSPLVTFDLGPLRRAEALELAQDYLDANSQFALTCIARAEGNPLFLEQLLRNAEEVGDDAVPGSVQSIVLARMDRLGQSDKTALQAASVIGQRFSIDALRHVIGDPDYGCANLVAHFLVRPEGEDYLFTNVLVRDGVYNSLLNARRRELHQRAAEWFADSDATLFAKHLDRANDPRSAQAYLAAARDQAARYRFENTLQLAERGLEVADDSATRYELGCLRGDMLRELGDSNRSIEAFELALEVANNEAQKCRAWIGMVAGMRIVDRYDEALTVLDLAEGTANEHGLVSELAQIHNFRGNIYFPLANFEGCLQQHELARKYARQSDSPEYEAQALGGLGDAYFVGGRMITAHDHFQRCIDVCKQNNLRRIEIANLHMLGETRLYKNELQAALDDCLAAADPAARIGHYRAELATRCVMAYLLCDMGRLSDAERESDQALIVARRLGARRFEALAQIYKAQVLSATNQLSEAIGHVEDAISIGRESGITYSGPWALGLLAKLTSDSAKRQSALSEGELILREGCVSHNYFWFYRHAMDACLHSGEWKEVDRFATALETYTKPEPLPWADHFVARGRALAAVGRGQRDDATTRTLSQLRDEAHRVGLNASLPALNEALKAA